MTFKDFNFTADLLDGLQAMGFEKPTPIQEQAIPIVLNNKDLIACAQTGTGKTAAYLLPVLHKIATTPPKKGVNTLIVAPTRELAMQIDQQVEGFSYFLSLTSCPIYGGGDGADFVRQQNALKKGADIIIATPGKLLSHLNLGYGSAFKNLEHLILDEADKMLDMGFLDDIMRIIKYLPQKRQTSLFSATMPSKIRGLAKKILHQPEQINIALSKPAEGVLQAAYVVYEDQKARLLKLLLDGKELNSAIVFAGTKVKVKAIAQGLKRFKFSADAIHSDLDQERREEILRLFKAKRIKIIVATDILARGIDIDSIDLIVNFDVPQDAEDYVHRVGRTARGEATGVALTFIGEREQNKFHRIEQLIETVVNKVAVPEELGNTPNYNPRTRSGGGGGGGKKWQSNRKGTGKRESKSNNKRK